MSFMPASIAQWASDSKTQLSTNWDLLSPCWRVYSSVNAAGRQSVHAGRDEILKISEFSEAGAGVSEELPVDIMNMSVPAQKYAVFPYTLSAIGATYRYITE